MATTMTGTMKAWVLEGFGGPDVYRFTEMPVPEPGEWEVQVQVDSAGLNPVDWKVREGKYAAAAPKTFPTVALREFSGTVTALGPGVTKFSVGDGVYGLTAHGAAAEFTVASIESIDHRPQSLGPVEAGVVPLACLTAWQALFDHGHVEAGQRVLIHAASGGVGTFAVQLAKWKGAYVIGTAAQENHQALHDLGADELIDYRTQKFEDVVSNVDMVLHSIGQDQVPASLKVLKPGGALIAISADPMKDEAAAQGKRAEVFSMIPREGQLRQIAELIDQGKLRPVIEEIVPFEQATKAMKHLEGGHVFGKIGIRIR